MAKAGKRRQGREGDAESCIKFTPTLRALSICHPPRGCNLLPELGCFASPLLLVIGHHPFGQIQLNKRAHHAAYTPQDVPASPALIRQGDTRRAQIWAFSHPNCQQRERRWPKTSKNINLRRYLQSKQGTHSNYGFFSLCCSLNNRSVPQRWRHQNVPKEPRGHGDGRPRPPAPRHPSKVWERAQGWSQAKKSAFRIPAHAALDPLTL